jgi:DNA-binding transcriptional LysR family regulator
MIDFSLGHCGDFTNPNEWGSRMREATPSLNALRAFESAARHESFAKAAAELCVSASAISQQVSQLESELGIRLFERVKQRLKLTEAGSTYRASLSSALDRIESATTDLIGNKGIQSLTIGSLPSLADFWLIPRLSNFVEQNPTIKLRIVTLDLDFSAPQRSPNLQGGRIQVGLFYGDGHWEGLRSEKIMNECLVPVVASKLLAKFQNKGLDADEVIASLPLMQHSTRPHSWDEWFRSRQKESRLPDGPSFEHFHMLVSAAKAGAGIALVPLSFIETELEANRLVRLGNHVLEAERAYYLIYDPANEHVVAQKTFREWVKRQSP